MDEQEYQADVQQLFEEMQQRANTAVDYIVTQPPIRQARLELYALLEWAFQMGAEQPHLIKERQRRRQLKRENPAYGRDMLRKS